MIKQYPGYEQYEVANIEDYGYKEHRLTKKNI